MNSCRSLFLLVAVLFAGSMFAQSIQIKERYTKVDVTNDTIKAYGSPFAAAISAYPIIYNVGQDTINLKLERHEHCVVLGRSHSICFGFTCNTENNGAKPIWTFLTDSIVLAPGDSTAWHQCYVQLHPDSIGGCDCYHVRLWDGWDVADSAHVHISACAWMVGLDEKITKLNEMNCSPNPTTGSVEVKFTIKQRFTNAFIRLRDVTGKVVAEDRLRSAIGKQNLDLTHIKPGVHFYTLVLDGTESTARKLVIAR